MGKNNTNHDNYIDNKTDSNKKIIIVIITKQQKKEKFNMNVLSLLVFDAFIFRCDRQDFKWPAVGILTAAPGLEPLGGGLPQGGGQEAL